MTDAAWVEKRLREPREIDGVRLPDDFVLPAYDGFSLVNVSATVVKHFGAETVPTAVLDERVTGDVLNGAKKVIVILLDAMGYLALKEQMAADPDLPLNAMAERGRFVPLTSIFPSTTAAALSAMHAGMPPTGTAITGYRMYFPEHGLLANMIRLGGDLDGRPNGLIPDAEGGRRLLGVPTVHQRLMQAGVPSYCMVRRGLELSGLSHMLFTDAADVIPFIAPADMFVTLRRMALADPGAPGCWWAYWDALDTSLHTYGVGQDENAAEVRNFAHSLKRELLDPLEAAGHDDVTVILTADHGQVQVNLEDIVPLSENAPLRGKLVAPPVGTSRAAYLYMRKRWAGDLEEARAAFGERALMLEVEAALRAGLWGTGEVRAEMRERIGDVLAVMTGTRALYHPYRHDSRPEFLLGGRHGGLHEGEMLTPFLAARY